MNRRTAVRLVLAGVLAAGVPACAVGRAAGRPSPPRVVIVSIDGLRPDALRDRHVAAPHLLGLARRGAFSWRARTIRPSITLPSHSSMLSGQPAEVHRITWNTWQPHRGLISVPTVFSVARRAGLRSAMVVSKPKLQHLRDPAVDSFVLLERSDREVAEAAARQAASGRFDLLFVHLSDVDGTGHARGWMSPAYLDAVRGADAALGRLLNALPDGTTVIVTADHGGHASSHGTAEDADVHIPWVIAGPTVRSGEIEVPVRTVDTAATALHVLGLELPPGTAGKVVSAAFSR